MDTKASLMESFSHRNVGSWSNPESQLRHEIFFLKHWLVYLEIATDHRTTDERVQIDWLLFGVHSIMMVKIQLSLVRVEGAGCRPSPFHSIYHQEQSCVVRSSYFSSTLFSSVGRTTEYI
jgi:hypothetical protein